METSYGASQGHDYQYFYMDCTKFPKCLMLTYWSEPYFDEGGGNILMTTYSHPIYTCLKASPYLSGTQIDVALDN